MPLFPPVNEPIQIKQGPTGDCYLLASLDSLIHNPDGYKKLTSMFRENQDGSVSVRIKITLQSARIQPERLEGKYSFYQDELSGEDVFTISKERLAEIDKSKDGVETNCLAVKILERISSYYLYDIPHVPGEPNYSVLAHNYRKAEHDKSTAFVANLLDLYVQDELTIKQIATLKKVVPDFPVYLSMQYATNEYVRHSYRVNQVINGVGFNQRIILVNPWDNSTTEEYSSEQLGQKKARLCFLAPNLASYHFAKWLINSDVFVEQIIANPPALQMMQDGIKQYPELGAGVFHRYQILIRNSPEIATYYELLSINQRKAIHSFLNSPPKSFNGLEVMSYVFSDSNFADLTRKIINDTEKFFENELILILTSVVKSKNQDTYQLLKQKYDLPLASVLRNNPELYDNLVYLDLKTPPVNTEMWANINKKNNPDASPYLEQRFLEFVIDRAAREKESPQLDFNSAKAYVKGTLIDHFFYPNEPAALTSAGNIRKLFTQPQPLFNREQILDATTPQEFSVRAVSYFLRNTVLTEGIRFQVRTPFVLSNDECRNILMGAPTKDLRLQISQIHSLSNYNSRVAKDLVLFAINNAQGLYKLSTQEVEEEIKKITDDSIKEWLAGITASIKSQPSFDWQVIEVKIKDFSASFGPENLEAIQAIKAKKINDLYQLTFNDQDSNVSTLNDLKENNQLPAGVKKALDLKINQIEQNAASAVLQAAARQLNSISINFKDCKDEKEIVKHEQTSFQKVNYIVNHQLVLDAVKKKGNTSMDFQLFELEKRRVKKSVLKKSDARLDEIQKVSNKANQGKPGLQLQVQEKKIQLNLSQEEQKFNVSLNQLDIDVTDKSSSEFKSIVSSLRNHLKAIGDILFSNARNENQNMSHGEIIDQLKVLVNDLHKQPDSKVRARIIRQFENAVDVINLTRNKILASGVNEDIIYQKFWMDLVSLTKGESKSNILLSSNQKQFSENAVALGKAMESLPDGPFKEKVTVVKQDLEQVAGDVFKADNKLSSNVNSAPNKLIGQLDNLAEVPRPSGWENIVQYLRTMINTLVASISALKNSILPNNNIGLFRTNSKDWDEVKVAADNLAEPAAAKNCKIQ
ncbi:MAG TPA: hypothetical protein PK657_06415 [Legionella sp.]|nr:hypothetical protein [Legionella sp.]